MIVAPHIIEKLQKRENLGSTQKFSANIDITPEVDEAVDYIAKYLYEYVNKDYFSYIEANPAIRQSLGDIAIRTYKTYDAYGISNQEFPLLKVYRVSDSWKMGKLIRSSSISISYSLVLPQQDKLMPLLNWMSYQINKHLMNTSCQVKIDPGVRVQYRTMINEVGQAIYSFLRADINITD